MSPKPIDNPEIIDVDAFEDVKRPVTVNPKTIVISDDDAEIIEVAAELSRNTQTRSISLNSNVEITENRPPPTYVIDLVSDDKETKPKPIRALSNGKQAASRAGSTSMNMPVPSTSRVTSSMPARSLQSNFNDPGSSRRERKLQIYGGPPSTIRLDTRIKLKQKRPVPKVESDSEEEYENSNINPYDHPPAKIEDFEPQTEPVEQIIDPRPPRKRRYVDISSDLFPSTSTPSLNSEYYIWDFLREYKLVPHFRPRPRFLSKRPRLGEALDVDHYVKAHQFRRAGGSITGILQHNGRVVVCSCTAGGTDTGETDPYNKPGTLFSWCKRDPSRILHLEQGYSLSGAFLNPTVSEEELARWTHYSVRSIAYDPIRQVNLLASSWADDYVRTWNFDANDNVEPYSMRSSKQYMVRKKTASPHDLVFKPGSSILAVGEQSLTVEDFSENGSRHTFDFGDTRYQYEHVTGAIAWGSGISSSLILALSEPTASNARHDGSHHAFDTDAQRSAFKFDAAEAGDALCIDPTGNTAALVTNDGVNSFLRIYDIRNKNSTATQTICLEPLASESREVNSMAFSPDSMYLALGRDDNCAHVYDCRMLQRRGMLREQGFIYNFKHSDTHVGSENPNLFGVVGVSWRQNRNKLGLVTGGNDGCIRLWDPLCGSKESTVLVQADADIANFTFGDRFNEEHELVVGDSDGGIYIMDGFADM
ncbi:WD-REPEATS-REGION domain-containing protein [Mycena venus]|uniref:WD-REPEATS-REGION domain-containing protein n=1 Tax=Mycena venus TaxID=2733690 RepID=A0A8H7CZG6_9AGAR|nr:WD-REPEATS-REGION domain-containing protein [Mycena venus]